MRRHHNIKLYVDCHKTLYSCEMVLCCCDIRGGKTLHERTTVLRYAYVGCVNKLIRFLVIQAFWDVMPCWLVNSTLMRRLVFLERFGTTSWSHLYWLETSVTDYHPIPLNMLEDWRSQLHRSDNLVSCVVLYSLRVCLPSKMKVVLSSETPVTIYQSVRLKMQNTWSLA